jgi:hypothetical protein
VRVLCVSAHATRDVKTSFVAVFGDNFQPFQTFPVLRKCDVLVNHTCTTPRHKCTDGTFLARSPRSPAWPHVAVSPGPQEQMLGRRSHPRCVIPASIEGVLCVSRDVLVRDRDGEHVTVVSREPGVPGERGQLTLPAPDAESVAVRLSTSRPIVIDGAVRHVLQLKLVVERVPDVA